uniref:Elongation factor 1-beta n=1 Tax=Ascaris suum TaxID=6253 RepID=F1LC17_ASCSU
MPKSTRMWPVGTNISPAIPTTKGQHGQWRAHLSKSTRRKRRQTKILICSDRTTKRRMKKKQESPLNVSRRTRKKAKKPAGIAKSNIIFDVKPWDDSIDVAEIEKKVRGIETDGLVWGTAKVLPIAYGINKLQICCVVEDEKVSSDWLEEQITGFEDLVQSVDVVARDVVADIRLRHSYNNIIDREGNAAHLMLTAG